MKVVLIALFTILVAACATTQRASGPAPVVASGSPTAASSAPAAPVSSALPAATGSAPATVSSVPPVATGSAPAAVSSAHASSSAASSSPAAAGSAAVVDQELVKRGYKPGQHDGEVVYCKRTLTPDRFPVNRCYTAEQIREIDRRTQGIVNHMTMPGNCVGWGCH